MFDNYPNIRDSPLACTEDFTSLCLFVCVSTIPTLSVKNYTYYYYQNKIPTIHLNQYVNYILRNNTYSDIASFFEFSKALSSSKMSS